MHMHVNMYVNMFITINTRLVEWEQGFLHIMYRHVWIFGKRKAEKYNADQWRTRNV